MRRIAWMAFLITAAIGSLAQSQPPAPTKFEHGGKDVSHAVDCTRIDNNHCADSYQFSPAVTVVVPPSPQGNEKPPDNKSNDPSPENRIGWSIHDPNTAIAAFTIILAIVGIGQACIACLQWRTYKAQTKIFIAQNRAHIFLKSLRLEPCGWEGDGKPDAWRVIATIANSGTTPPRNLRVAIFKSVVPSETVGTVRFEPSYETAKKVFVGPQSSIDIHAADVRDNPVGKKTLIWGWMEYDDIFSPWNRHRTEFCFEFGCGALVDMDSGSSTLLPEFVMHERHNGMDEDCMHRPRPYQG